MHGVDCRDRSRRRAAPRGRPGGPLPRGRGSLKSGKMIERPSTCERVLEAMREWRSRFRKRPSSCDWPRTHARPGGEALQRLNERSWPSASEATSVSGAGPAARTAAGDAAGSGPQASTTDGRCEVGDRYRVGMSRSRRFLGDLIPAVGGLLTASRSQCLRRGRRPGGESGRSQESR